MKRGLLACAVAVLAAAYGCSGPAAPTDVPPTRLGFTQQVAPDPRVPLSAGSLVDFSLGVVSYMDTAGRMTLSLRDQSGAVLVAPEPTVDLAAFGTALVQASFTVPVNATAVEGLAVFEPSDPRGSRVLVHVAYTVGR